MHVTYMKLGMRIQIESKDYCSTYSLTAAAAACLQKHGGNFTACELHELRMKQKKCKLNVCFGKKRFKLNESYKKK